MPLVALLKVATGGHRTGGSPGRELLGTAAPLLVGTSEMSHTVGEKGKALA